MSVPQLRGPSASIDHLTAVLLKHDYRVELRLAQKQKEIDHGIP